MASTPAFTFGLPAAEGTATNTFPPAAPTHRYYRRSSTRHRRRATPWPAAPATHEETKTEAETTTTTAAATAAAGPTRSTSLLPADPLLASLACPLTGQLPADPVTTIEDGKVRRPSSRPPPRSKSRRPNP